MRGSYSTIICKVVLVLTAAGFLGACEYHELKQNPGDLAPKELKANQTVDANLVQNFVLHTCKDCHGKTTKPVFKTVDEIKENIGKIQSEINSNQMPPTRRGYSPLSECEKEILQVWVNEGMPASSTTMLASLPSCISYVPSQPPPPPRPAPKPHETKTILEMPLNYQTLNSQIIQKKCQHCHNPQGDDIMAAMYLFGTYADITSHGKLLGTNRNDSNFVKMLEGPDDKRMPPDYDGPRLTEEEIEFVRRWVDAGHPEN